jgi:hypothetical protein
MSPQGAHHIRFQVFTAVSLRIMLSWAVTLFSSHANLLEGQRTCCLHFSVKMSEDFGPSMEEAYTSKMLLSTYNTTWHHDSKSLQCELPNTTGIQDTDNL